jgi:hypothetical protein
VGTSAGTARRRRWSEHGGGSDGPSMATLAAGPPSPASSSSSGRAWATRLLLPPLGAQQEEYEPPPNRCQADARTRGEFFPFFGDFFFWNCLQIEMNKVWKIRPAMNHIDDILLEGRETSKFYPTLFVSMPLLESFYSCGWFGLCLF